MNPDNVYINFRYENTSGVAEPIKFEDITKRVPVLNNPSQYEVAVTNFYGKVTGSSPTPDEFGRVVVMSNSIGVSQEFSNDVQNDLQPVISDFLYPPITATSGIIAYPSGYLFFPNIYNSEVHYRDVFSSDPLYRLNLSVKAHMKDGTYEDIVADAADGSCFITLHFRKKR